MAVGLASGGVAMTVVGAYGNGVRGDAEVTVSDAPSFRFELVSDVEPMYGSRIRGQIERAAAMFGNPPVELLVRDGGALPFVLQARLVAGFSAHLSVEVPPLGARAHSFKLKRLRTRLYVPGNTPKLFPNAALYRPDAIILDLEDSVAVDQKFAARVLVTHALNTLAWGDTLRFVRINGIEDARALIGQGVDAFLIPKVESPEAIQEIAALLGPTETRIIPILESALGIERAFEIASSSPRILGMAIGLEDYVRDIGAQRTATGEESAWAQGRVVNAARAAGVQPLASVFSKVDDEEGMYQYALQSRLRGFAGVACIHPRQIAPSHRAFAPSPQEREQARAIVEAFEKEGGGVLSVQDQMVDAPVYERARRALEEAVD
ncbi:MAG TPA: aldolase/citrate lyase family protein [Fimbriimonas sp.]|nr:aldolase/citrate lyase family protein [Fimbriimonas sp.]